MGQTLTNGIYLPAEGERNCYEGLAANWTALDGLIGGYNVHIGNTAIHVTAEDKAAWNGKADASALTAHTGDTTIHVTAADKQAWNGKQDALSQTQLDAVNSGIDSSKVQQIAANTSDISSLQSDKANDSDVVHKSGNETISGTKSFPDGIVANVTGSATSATYDGSGNVINSTYGKLGAVNEWTSVNIFRQNVTYQRTNLYHQVANPCYILKDTELEKGSIPQAAHTAYPGLWQDKNNNILGYVRFVEYSSGWQRAEFRVSNLIKDGTLDPTGSEVNCTVYLELQPSGEKSLIPEQNNDINLGTATKKWKSFNGLTPSSLSLPATTGVVDISSYITDLTGTANTYTVLANGYIQFDVTGSSVEIDVTNGLSQKWMMTDPKGFIPVVSGASVSIKVVGTAINNFKFIPCQGNI